MDSNEKSNRNANCTHTINHAWDMARTSVSLMNSLPAVCLPANGFCGIDFDAFCALLSLSLVSYYKIE